MPSVAPGKIDCGDCPIRHRAVCSRCEPDELTQLNEMKTYRAYKAGETIAWAGDQTDFVASVVTGAATLSQTMEDGRRQMVGLLLPSDFIGRPGRGSINYDVTASSELILCRFDRRDFEKLIASSDAIAHRLLEMTLDELDAARDWMLILGRKTARERLASFLAVIAGRQANLSPVAPDGPVTFDLPLTREAIADYLGLTIETVSRQFSALRKSGVIRLEGNRHVIVPDRAALLGESGDDSDGGVFA